MKGGERRCAVPWLLLLLAAVALAPAAVAQAPPAQRSRVMATGHVVARSLDSVQKLANDVGAPLPPLLTAEGLEGQLPFLEPDSIATDRPIGIVMFSGQAAAGQATSAIVLPMKPGKVTVESLVRQGAKRVVGRDDAVTKGGTFRRTDKYLIFGSPPDRILAVNEAVIAGALKDPAAVARFTVDLKAVKAATPGLYEDFLEQNGMRNVGPTRGEQVGARMGVDFMKGLDRMTLGVDRQGQTLSLGATIEPLPAPPPTRGVTRPGMPPGLVARLDVTCPPTKLMPVLRTESFRKFMDQSAEEMRLKPGQRAKVLDVFARASQVVLGADATSVGVHAAGDSGPVVYVVNQYARPFDVIKEVREVVRQLQGMGAELGDEEPALELSTY